MTNHHDEPCELALEGIYAGLFAGALFAIGEMVVAAAHGGGLATPLVVAASVLMRERAFAAPALLVIPVGLMVHGCVAAVWGYFFGLVVYDDAIDSPYRVMRQLVAGTVMGTFIWALDLKILARMFQPAMARVAGHPAAGDATQLLLHGLVFGAPMGLAFAYLERRRGAARAWRPL